jgi:4-alpha-glucanotransferase
MNRCSGIFLHITSLPSVYGIGDMGPEAYRFVDLISSLGQSLWQVLPCSATSIEYGNSPYDSYSVYAGNPILISPEELYKEDLISREILENHRGIITDRVNYHLVTETKNKILRIAFENFNKNIKDYIEDFEKFRIENSSWLNDFALYCGLKEKFREPWYHWPEKVRDKDINELQEERELLEDLIRFEEFKQFQFQKQWSKLRNYCQKQNIRILGDLPFYVNYDSADIWSNQNLVKLDKDKRKLFVGGVPPDYFSEHGQLWGNPVYDWNYHNAQNFGWWIDRIRYNLKLFDMLRLDHFRGFIAYWEIPAGTETAREGRWVESPTEDFFKNLIQNFGNERFIAEDLGYITKDVKDVMKKFRIPGMNILIFSIKEIRDHYSNRDNNELNSLISTSTHDTNTVRGWYREEASFEEKNMLSRIIGKQINEETVSSELIKLAMRSKEKICIIPMQDILSLGSESRMNYPSKSIGNWEWRCINSNLYSEKLDRIKEITEKSGRNFHANN